MTRAVLGALAALLITFLVGRVVDHDILHRFAEAYVVVSSGSAGQLEFYHQHPPGAPGFVPARRVSVEVTKGQRNYIRVPLRQVPVSRFRLRVVGIDSQLTLHAVTLRSRYGSDVSLEGGALAEFFAPFTPTTRIESSSTGLRLSGDGGIVDLVTAQKIGARNPLLAIGLPLLAGGLVFFYARRFRFSRIPAIVQISGTPVGMAKHVGELDGLRGIAAISVVADHTWGPFSGSGLVGVWIFFALSGYLLAIPFVRRPMLIFEGAYVEQYLFRRLARILPMYYATLLATYVMGGFIHPVVPHFLFLRGDGHFWTIPQEMLFYLVLPAVMVAMAVLTRARFALAMAVLAACTLAFMIYHHELPTLVYGEPASNRPYVGWFLSGVLVSYLVNSPELERKAERFKASVGAAVGWTALPLMVILFALSSIEFTSFLAGRHVNPVLQYQMTFGLGAAFLVFAAVFGRESPYGWLLRNRFFRLFGILGYSVYLLHPFLIEVIREFSRYYLGRPLAGFELFAATMVLTWLVSMFTYNLIEYPFLARRRTDPPPVRDGSTREASR